MIINFESYNENFKKSLNRSMKAARGQVPGWENFTEEERIEYLSELEGQLEVDYNKIIFPGVSRGPNHPVWVMIMMIITRLGEHNFEKLQAESKWRISNNEDPILVLDDILSRIDINKLVTEDDEGWFIGKTKKVLNLKDKSFNIFVDDWYQHGNF